MSKNDKNVNAYLSIYGAAPEVSIVRELGKIIITILKTNNSEGVKTFAITALQSTLKTEVRDIHVEGCSFYGRPEATK